MKIIRWFFSHAFLIVLIVAVIYSYMYWGNLIGEDTPAGKALAYLSEEFETVDEFMVAVREKQAEHESTTVDSATSDSVQHDQSAQQEQQVETVQDDTPEVAREASREAPLEENQEYSRQDTTSVASEEVVDKGGEDAVEEAALAADEPVSISYSHNEQRVEQDSEGRYMASAVVASQTASAEIPQSAAASRGETVSDEVAAQNTETAEQSVDAAAAATGPAAAEQFVSEEIAEQLDNVDDSGRVIDPSKSNELVRQEWIRARQAFYKRDYEQSEKSYLQVIDSTKNNFDAYGELGNVYFNQGKRQEAAQAYFDAASILVRRGEKLRARSLMGLLRRLDAAKAEELQKLVQEPAGS